MKKMFYLLIAFSILFAGILWIKDSTSQFRYVGEDEIGKWYFDRSSIETRIDEETGVEIIDVWMKREIRDTKITCGVDNLLWHVDFVNSRYKVSDAVAVNRDGSIAET